MTMTLSTWLVTTGWVVAAGGLVIVAGTVGLIVGLLRKRGWLRAAVAIAYIFIGSGINLLATLDGIWLTPWGIVSAVLFGVMGIGAIAQAVLDIRWLRSVGRLGEE